MNGCEGIVNQSVLEYFPWDMTSKLLYVSYYKFKILRCENKCEWGKASRKNETQEMKKKQKASGYVV